MYNRYKNKLELEIWNFLECNHKYANSNNYKKKNLVEIDDMNIKIFYNKIEDLYKDVSDKDNAMETNKEEKNIKTHHKRSELSKKK